MKRLTIALNAACAWVNPGLIILALVLALLDVAAATERWTVAHPQASASAKTVIVAASSEACAPAVPPELREMAGRD